MSSLKNLSIMSIADHIMQSPPIIQEMVIGETVKNIKDKVTKEVNKEIETRIPFLVKIILDDIKQSITFTNRPRTNFYAVFNHIDKSIIKAAIDTADILFENRNIIPVNYSQSDEDDDEHDDEHDEDDEDDEHDDYDDEENRENNW
jgi:hypothetical protein